MLKARTPGAELQNKESSPWSRTDEEMIKNVSNLKVTQRILQGGKFEFQRTNALIAKMRKRTSDCHQPVRRYDWPKLIILWTKISFLKGKNDTT